jgi:hypothetical protein
MHNNPTRYPSACSITVRHSQAVIEHDFSSDGSSPAANRPRRRTFTAPHKRRKLSTRKPGKQALDILSGDRPMIAFTKTA